MKLTTKLGTARQSKVVKRPARGFHRFRNGVINTTPKGREEGGWRRLALRRCRLFNRATLISNKIPACYSTISYGLRKRKTFSLYRLLSLQTKTTVAMELSSVSSKTFFYDHILVYNLTNSTSEYIL
jgi:hypothetical protein